MLKTKATRWELPVGATCAIGSLPHHNIDAALSFAFRSTVPYLPQIPIRNPWEYAVPQALEGIPGIRVEEGSALLDIDVWSGRARSLDESLARAFESASEPNAFEAFEPSAATSSSWQPFLWELEEQKTRVAKVQIAGPLTAQWVLQLTQGESADRYPEVSAQIYRLVLARALAMSRRLASGGVQPIVFLDEPALYVLDKKNPRHVLGLQELRLMIQALGKEDCSVGIHCCSDTDWSAVLELGVHWISFDTALSLPSLLKRGESIARFVEGGGRFSFGVIPTSNSEAWSSFEPRQAAENLFQSLTAALGEPLARKMWREALWTPACGLALHTPSNAEVVQSLLAEFSLAVAER